MALRMVLNFGMVLPLTGGWCCWWLPCWWAGALPRLARGWLLVALCCLRVAGAVPACLFGLVGGVIVNKLNYVARFACALAVAASAQQVAVRNFVVSAVSPGEAGAGFCIVCGGVL